MCLAIPMEIIEINADTAVVRSKGVETSVNIMLTPDVIPGDKVLVHAGFSIEKMDSEAAREIEEIWEKYISADNS